MISEVWREFKHVARELGSLVMTLLPWLPIFGLAIIGLERLGSPAAGLIVFLTPWYRWLLRGGRAPRMLVWLLVASAAIVAVNYIAAGWPTWLVAMILVLGSLFLRSGL